MKHLFCVIILLFGIFTSAFAEDYPDGTVVVWENGNMRSIVQRQTGSNKTHAGIVLYEGTQAYVYEAAKPDVHRYTIEQYERILDQYHKKFPDLGVYFLKPRTPYTTAQLQAMKKYANANLGRAFGVRSYMTGKPQVTIHCCEYIGNILYCSGRYHNLGPKETPKTIFDKASKL